MPSKDEVGNRFNHRLNVHGKTPYQLTIIKAICYLTQEMYPSMQIYPNPVFLLFKREQSYSTLNEGSCPLFCKLLHRQLHP